MKIIGLCIAGEKGEYFDKTKECFERLCNHTVYWEDTREWGKFQNVIKEDALKFTVEKFNPDWILALDTDEELMCTREQLEELTKSDEISYKFYFVQKWNDEEHVNENFHFWDMRFFKWMPELGYKYQNTPLHCGMGPFWAYKYAWDAPYIVIHRGLMSPEDRKRKVERYEKYDPKMVYCSPLYYEGLKSTDKGTSFDWEEEQRKVEEAVKKNGTRTRPPIEIPKKVKQHRVLRFADNCEMIIDDKYLEDTLNQGGRESKFKYLGEIAEEETVELKKAPVILKKVTPLELEALIKGGAESFWVRRSDGFVFECHKNAIYDQMKQPGFELIGEIRVAKPIPITEIPIEEDPFECKECGFVGKNANGLRLHARRHR